MLREIVEQYLATRARRLPHARSPSPHGPVTGHDPQRLADLTDTVSCLPPYLGGASAIDQVGLFVEGLLNFGELPRTTSSISAALAALVGAWKNPWPRLPLLSGLSAAAGWCWRPIGRRGEAFRVRPPRAGRALVVLVNSDGHVENRVIETPPACRPRSAGDNYLNAGPPACLWRAPRGRPESLAFR